MRLSRHLRCFVHDQAEAAVAALLRHGLAHYRRERDLPRLLPGYCAAVPALPPPAAADLMARLRQALTRERRLGALGHWSYDPTRHRLLAVALAAEDRAGRKRKTPPRRSGV